MKGFLSNDIKIIEEKVKKDGYAVINVDNTYFYTVGMGNVGKPDIIALPMFPESLFQAVANLHYRGECTTDTPFFLDLFKVKTALMGEEPTRVVLRSLDFDTIQHLMTGLMTNVRKFKTRGVVCLLGPDKHNFLPNEPESLIQFDLDEKLVELAQAVHQEVDKNCNEAIRLLRSLGVSVK